MIIFYYHGKREETAVLKMIIHKRTGPPSGINLGISHQRITLTSVMDVRSIIALFMGLVLQLSQVQTCLATEAAKPCATQARLMSCCEGLKTCPCAKKSRENQKPTPLLPASGELKLLLSKAPEPSRLGAFVSPPAAAKAVVATPALGWSAYAGVPLSVAFCRFVI